MNIKWPITRRQDSAAYHESLNPETDYGEIFEQLFAYDFPVEFLLAAELAQLRTFIFPNGTKLLHQTAEFEQNSLKRLDDTRAILVEMGKDGFDSPHAKTMADHLNAIHGYYDIPNEEFIYTLGTFIFDPWLMINQHGWRKLTRNEELAIFYTYRDMGELMKIQDVPETFEAYWEWMQIYEAEKAEYAETNYLVSEGLFRGLEQMVSPVLRPFLRPFALTLLGKRVANLLGYDYPNPLWRAPVWLGLWLHKQVNRFFTLWDTISFEQLILSDFQSYPNGYNPRRLGPKKIIQHLEKMRQKEAVAEATA